MELNMHLRQNQLSDLETYLNEVDTEVTMILQSLQWDRKHLLEQRALVPCQYNTHHRIPPDKLMEHESACFLKSQGYMENDRLLPSPLDPDASTLVKLDADNIAEIINNAASSQALFKSVESGPFGCDRFYRFYSGCSGNQPLTLERLQSTYTADERRAIHSAVVAQVPSCHDLSDLDLLSSKDESKEAKPKSKLEILAELRNMKRRRTKYRVAAKTRNYSDVLRDVINTQMELYTQAQDNVMDRIKKEKVDIEDEVTDSYRSNEKNTGPNQISKATEDRHSEISHHYESRKRRHNDTYDAYNSARRSNTQERDRTSPRKAYEYKDKHMPYGSNSTRKDYRTSYKREDRSTDYSKVNNDRHKYDDDDERRNIRRDKSGDNSGETHSKHTSVSTKDLRKRKHDLGKDGSSGTRDNKRSKDRHYSSKGNYSNVQRETQNHDQYEHTKLRRDYSGGNSNKTCDDQQKLEQAVITNVKRHSYHYNSYSSDGNVSEYMERSEIHDKSKRTHHSYKAHYSKEEKQKDRNFTDCQKNKNGHDLYKHDNHFQVECTKVVKKEENISEDESDISDYSKYNKPYNTCERSTEKYNRHDKRNKKKYRDKSIEYEKDDTYRRQKRRETEKQHTDKHIHIKEEIDSNEDDQDERMDNRDSSHRYNRDDKRYSKSYEERLNKDSDLYNSRRRYEDSSDRYRKN